MSFFNQWVIFSPDLSLFQEKGLAPNLFNIDLPRVLIHEHLWGFLFFFVCWWYWGINKKNLFFFGFAYMI
uniref:Uncharacterized protein n=1 Tax=Arundo donax TaxID=35708 RepID=A0A0A8ZJ89_ARUDO